jgi:hypothetical protein
MATLRVERVGGLAGMGGTNSHVRSQGQVDDDALSSDDREAIETLFRSKEKRQAKLSEVRDGFRYKISRATAAGVETVEAPESAVPAILARCVKDELV